MITPVILSGGGGTRLWPLSRAHFPKQYWPLAGSNTQLQDTALRVLDSKHFTAPLVLCHEEHRFLVAEQLRQISISPLNIVLEAETQNTTTAITLACLLRDPDAALLILPADHAISTREEFIATVINTQPLVDSGHIVAFGISPKHPDTRYGYLEKGEQLKNQDAYVLQRFTEKPNSELAQQFIDSQNYYWNSGIYLFKAAVMLEELERLQPETVKNCRAAIKNAYVDLDFLRLPYEQLKENVALSIDYAVMEHTQKAVLVPAQFTWSDVGSWDALWEISEKNKDNNAIHGDVLTENVQNSYLRTENHLLSVIGLDNIVVVATNDATLIADKNSVHDLKGMIKQLKDQKRTELTCHTRVYRPWGYYQCIDKGERFQVKRLMIKPGAKTSVQIHFHRSEHWVVVQGTATILRGDDTLLIHENESVYLPMGIKHRVENPGKIPLHLIEVQSGSYLGEDDIVRLEDAYGRIEEKEPSTSFN